MYKAVLFISILSILSFSCEKAEETISGDASLTLEFSADTVNFDTIFTIQNSVTRRLRVFNRNKEAVNVSEISIEGGVGSPFTIFVNGVEGKSFNDIVINGRDSILILVEVFIESQNEDLPFIIQENLTFTTNGNVQDVLLLSFGQDAVRLSNQIIACNSTWTSARPYLIQDTVLIDSLCLLTMEPGTRIFFEPGAIFFVAGTLQVEGDVGNRVVFTNSRKDFSEVPGQWKGIFFLEGSIDNRIDFAEIRNAEVGLRLGTPDNDTIPDLVLSNSIIENMSGSGLLCFNSDVYAYNTLINNCAIFTVGNLAGGSYRYEHCTFASFGFDFFRNEPSTVFSDNLVLPGGSLLVNDLKVSIKNSIIWGILSEELIFSESTGMNFLSLDYNILKTEITALDTGNNVLNQDPLFIDAMLRNYRLMEFSPAINGGKDLSIILDLDGLDRDSIPDQGAYEWRPD